MSQAKSGDKVRVHYTGKLTSGEVFDSSQGRDPLEFTIGAGQVIPGFESAAAGLSVGETTTTTIAPEEAYGPRRDEMIMAVERTRLPEPENVEVGQQYQLVGEGGQQIQVEVTAVDEQNVTLDGNHPLAGKDLVFDIELVEIVEAA